MDLKTFYQKSAGLLAKMQEEELRLCLHNMARKTAVNKRWLFIQLLEDSFGQADQSKAEYKQLIPEEQVKIKLTQIINDFASLDEGTICLTAQGYEDYSSGWPSDWVYEYTDMENITPFIEAAVRFAHDLLYDCRYEEALKIFDLAINSQVTVVEEGSGDVFSLDLAGLVSEGLLDLDLNKLGLAAIYASYQVHQPEQRPAAIYSYFGHYFLAKIKLEDFLSAGREELADHPEFFQAWLDFLKQQGGDLATRLLREAILCQHGPAGLAKAARDSYQLHPTLFLTALLEYEKAKDYPAMQELGQEALALLDPGLKIRAELAKKTAQAAWHLNNKELMMKCWYEAFAADPTPGNYLRLYSEPEAKQSYQELAKNKIRQLDMTDLALNEASSFTKKQFRFFTGEFGQALAWCQEKKENLGWSGHFIEDGVDLFLLLLYEGQELGQAGRQLAKRVARQLDFAPELADESKLAAFWPSFKHWQAAHPLAAEEKKEYLAWLEKVIDQRINAIVSGKYNSRYASVALLAAGLGELLESWGQSGKKKTIIDQYQARYPRHSSFRRELRAYLDQEIL